MALALPAGAMEIGPEKLTDLPASDVVILGEVHDNPIHHAQQARAIAALQPAALVFEMLTADQAARITAGNRNDAEALAEVLGWAGSGWPDFAHYHQIMIAAPEARILGGGLPRGEVRRAVSEGAAAVFGPESARYGLDRALPAEEQAARERAQATAHCDALPSELLPGMVAAQRLRDAALARAVMRAVEAGQTPVAVIAGNGHARRDRGVPVYLSAALPGLQVLGLGQIEAEPAGDPPFDLWLVTDPAERDDPCAAFTRD